MTEKGIFSVKDRKIISKNEIFVLLLLLIVCVAALAVPRLMTKNRVAEIYSDKKLVQTIDLRSAANGSFKIGETIVEIKDGKIGFTQSTCSGKQCINTGFIDSPPQVAVCLPNRVYIKIIGDSNMDTIAY